MCRQTLSSFGTSVTSYTSESVTEADIDIIFADKWRGTAHKRNVTAGAKSVNIAAKVDTYNLE